MPSLGHRRASSLLARRCCGSVRGRPRTHLRSSARTVRGTTRSVRAVLAAEVGVGRAALALGRRCPQRGRSGADFPRFGFLRAPQQPLALVEVGAREPVALQGGKHRRIAGADQPAEHPSGLFVERPSHADRVTRNSPRSKPSIPAGIARSPRCETNFPHCRNYFPRGETMDPALREELPSAQKLFPAA